MFEFSPKNLHSFYNLVEYLKKLTLEEIGQFLGKHLRDGEDCRKLSTQVIGVGSLEEFNQPGQDESDETNQEDVTDGKKLTNMSLEMLPLENGYKGQLINNIDSFKDSLVIYPAWKLDH
ncbi:hypothetical protein BSL78_03341 [Apostichopus japonicus]|uniref:Uncharacterized protein n=1 Tax=Stichopus japonicus TaxID=307972 RepID=A0A2G8LHN8_STIJA|nr:hypothetical protein BSL78_03341 [Apostichopus japonicus]